MCVCVCVCVCVLILIFIFIIFALLCVLLFYIVCIYLYGGVPLVWVRFLMGVCAHRGLGLFGCPICGRGGGTMWMRVCICTETILN